MRCVLLTIQFSYQVLHQRRVQHRRQHRQQAPQALQALQAPQAPQV